MLKKNRLKFRDKLKLKHSAWKKSKQLVMQKLLESLLRKPKKLKKSWRPKKLLRKRPIKSLRKPKSHNFLLKNKKL